MDIVLVDDTVEPFTQSPSVPPEGILIEREHLSRDQSTRYAQTFTQPKEPWTQARDRLSDWTSTLSLPKGTWFGFAETVDYSEEGHPTVTGVRTYLLRGPPIISANDITDAEAVPDANGGAYVAVTLSDNAGERFRVATRENVKRRLAIIVGGKVETAPVIQSEIGGARLMITLGTTEEPLKDAVRLAKALGGD
jgi:preprotein translocase subunit SecD